MYLYHLLAVFAGARDLVHINAVNEFLQERCCELMISLTERELKTPSVAVCAALAQALGCTLDELVFGSADNAGERGDGDESQSPA